MRRVLSVVAIILVAGGIAWWLFQAPKPAPLESPPTPALATVAR